MKNFYYLKIDITTGNYSFCLQPPIDLVDCRPGMFSPVFADMITDTKAGMKFRGLKKDSLRNLELLTVTLIGSERTLSLKFPSQEDRNNFYIGMSSMVELMKYEDAGLHDAFVRYHKDAHHTERMEGRRSTIGLPRSNAVEYSQLPQNDEHISPVLKRIPEKMPTSAANINSYDGQQLVSI